MVLILTLWAFGALWYDVPWRWLGRTLAPIYAIAVCLAWWRISRPWLAFAAAVAAFLVVLGWWLTLKPRQDRDWRSDVAVLGYANIAGERVTIHNIRNSDYRTETDYTPKYDTRTFDLARLRGLDLFLTYWGSPSMAHPILSFDFGEQGHVCFSIETRPEHGEAYDAIAGLYRQFELICIAADERDVIRLRTNYRPGEDVYLYHLILPPEQVRERFLDYCQTINDLAAHPQWYNAITSNCTTTIRTQHAVDRRAEWDWRILLNGYMDEMLYEKGMVSRDVPFAELKRRSLINPRAKEVNDAPDFSTKIRAGLPGFP